MTLLSAYFTAGFINLMFSIMGLIFVVYVDINSREVEFSIMKVVGYSNKYISINYILSIINIMFTSFVIAFALAYASSLNFSLLVTIIVGLIVLAVLSIISLNSVNFIKEIKVVEIIGGENV